MTKSKKKKADISNQPGELRPPVVSILGHIDHGKTSLLDFIRKTKVALGETGGITQRIGAYQVEFKGKKITFIDTPGHAAFAKMRARGAKATDLAILVVAGDEGIKPQTRESLKFIRQAKIPFLVAVNKIDLPSSNVEMVTKQLEKEDVLVEKRGGEVVLVPVSAKSGEGVENLLEMILLIAEMNDWRADPKASLKGVVVESKLDSSRGPVATVLIKSGRLSRAETIWAEGVKGKVRAMRDEVGREVKQAIPSQPVEILGFESPPPVGAQVSRLKSVPVAESVSPKSKSQPKSEEAKAKSEEVASQEPEQSVFDEVQEKGLKLILKADAQGTLEAIEANLPAQTEVIYRGVGDICESDVLLAQTTTSFLIGFGVRLPSGVKKLAQIERVKVQIFHLIYELLEEIEKRQLKISKPMVNEEILGEAEILRSFQVNQKKIIGARVLSGRIARGDKIHLRRGKKVLADSLVKSLKQGKIEVDKVKAEEEFGALLLPEVDFKKQDVLTSFRELPSKG